MKSYWRLGVAAAITALLFLAASAPSDAARRAGARSIYDGTWSVAIYTQRGDCGSVRAALQIAGGRVYSPDSNYQAYGGVGAGGAIRVTVSRGDQSASGSGRLSRATGVGRWRSARGECSGTWTAERRQDYY